ncbi:MAG: hypothetical protein WBV77_11860 [Solirubrobacteraceae bacterium]
MLCTVVLAACGRPATSPGESPTGCVRSLTTTSIAPESGATLTVKAGAVVYVALVEAEKYLSWPAGTKPPPRVFPWAAARSSDPSVLRHVALCPEQRGLHAARRGVRLPRADPRHDHAHSSYRASLEARQAGTTPRLAPLSRDRDRGELSLGWHTSELKLLCA